MLKLKQNLRGSNVGAGSNPPWPKKNGTTHFEKNIKKVSPKPNISDKNKTETTKYFGSQNKF